MDAEALQQGVLHDRVVLVVPVHELAGDLVEHPRLVEQVLLGEPAEAVGGWTLAGHGQRESTYLDARAAHRTLRPRFRVLRKGVVAVAEVKPLRDGREAATTGGRYANASFRLSATARIIGPRRLVPTTIR
jgi:hypothetical protein